MDNIAKMIFSDTDDSMISSYTWHSVMFKAHSEKLLDGIEWVISSKKAIWIYGRVAYDHLVNSMTVTGDHQRLIVYDDKGSEYLRLPAFDMMRTFRAFQLFNERC